MSSSQTPSTEWAVLYHAPKKMKGRGEFLRLMLEDAGKTYLNSDENLYGPGGMFDAFRGSVDAIDTDSGTQAFPLFFPPAIWHRPASGGGEEVMVNQVGACMIYLGEQLGYAPSNAAERARADSILLNCLDYIAEGRASFHPVKNSMSYYKQKEEGDTVSKQFTKDRMKKFLHHFHKVVSKYGATKPVAGGVNVTYADFALFHVLDATISQFNTDFYEYAWDQTNVPALKDFHAHFKERPNLKAYFASDRCTPFEGNSMM